MRKPSDVGYLLSGVVGKKHQLHGYVHTSSRTSQLLKYRKLRHQQLKKTAKYSVLKTTWKKNLDFFVRCHHQHFWLLLWSLQKLTIFLEHNTYSNFWGPADLQILTIEFPTWKNSQYVRKVWAESEYFLKRHLQFLGIYFHEIHLCLNEIFWLLHRPLKLPRWFSQKQKLFMAHWTLL